MTPTPRIGDPAPDFTLTTPEGEALRLADLWKNAPRALALVFVRHWG